MIDLAPLFKNFFADRQHSLKELSRYGSKHLIFLTANNPANVLDAVITEVSGAFTLFVGCLGDEEARAALREAANLARNNLKASLTGPAGTVSRAAAAVAGAYGKGSPDYTACFPLGVEGFARASNVQMAERLENLRVELLARTANPAITPHVTTITAAHTQWLALNTAAGAALGAESATEDERDACREAVTKAFTRSALWLAWHFNGQPEKFDLYCPVYLLKNTQAHVPGPCTIEVSGGEGSISTTGHASGANIIRWYQRLVGATEWVELGNGPADEEVTFDTLPPGNYEVKARAENDEGPGPDSAVSTVTVS